MDLVLKECQMSYLTLMKEPPKCKGLKGEKSNRSFIREREFFSFFFFPFHASTRHSSLRSLRYRELRRLSSSDNSRTAPHNAIVYSTIQRAYVQSPGLIVRQEHDSMRRKWAIALRPRILVRVTISSGGRQREAPVVESTFIFLHV